MENQWINISLNYGLVLILIIALIIFGPAKLPQLGKAVGQTLSEFKKSTKDVIEDVAEPIEQVKESFTLQEVKDKKTS